MAAETAHLKMYILIRESIAPGFAVLAAAHASLAAYLKFKDTPEVAEWISGTFYKAVCRVTDEEFERAKTFSTSRQRLSARSRR
jgi:peptidyl-tRNA hydrolase